MLIGQDVEILDVPLLAIACSLDQIVCLGMTKSNLLLPDQVLRVSIPRSMAVAAFKLIWIAFLLHDVNIYLDIPPILFSENRSALYLTTNPMFQVLTKHIELDYHLSEKRSLDVGHEVYLCYTTIN